MTSIKISNLCLCLLILLVEGNGIQYIVEEQTPLTRPHMHPLRKHGKAVSPYKSASSITTNSKSQRYESFSLNCPHVADAANKDVKLEVTWTVNDTIWLKVEDGRHTVANKLSTFSKKTVSGKSILRVMLNNGRYFFDYDEITGSFQMEIHPVSIKEDVGVWQCHVTVHQEDHTYTLTSRSRVKVPRGNRHEIEEVKKNPILPPTAESQLFTVERRKTPEGEGESTRPKISSFARTDGGLIHISRDESIKYNMVVFNRDQPYLRNRVMKPVRDYDDFHVKSELSWGIKGLVKAREMKRIQRGKPSNWQAGKNGYDENFVIDIYQKWQKDEKTLKIVTVELRSDEDKVADVARNLGGQEVEKILSDYGFVQEFKFLRDDETKWGLT